MSGRAQLRVRERLAAGPSRGLGAANAVAAEVVHSESMLKELLAALQDDRAAVMARAANALKKVQTRRPELLEPYGKAIVQAAMECSVLEARWNLIIVLGGLRLRGRDRALAVELMFEALQSEGAFLRTFAMQSLVDLAAADAALRARVRPIVEEFAANGTAAMRARARKLLPEVRR